MELLDGKKVSNEIKEEIKAEVAKEKVCTIRTRRGAEVVELPIPCTN